MNRPFAAIFPQSITDGDKVLLRGTLKYDADVYSINFAQGANDHPTDIAYHFKTIIHDGLIVENTKRHDEWQEEVIKHWKTFDDYTFGLEFAFTNGVIYVYGVEDDNSRNPISFYPRDLNIDIHSVQIWGDVAKIYELRFQSGAKKKKRSINLKPRIGQYIK